MPAGAYSTIFASDRLGSTSKKVVEAITGHLPALADLPSVLATYCQVGSYDWCETCWFLGKRSFAASADTAGSCDPSADIELFAVAIHLDRLASVHLRLSIGGSTIKPDLTNAIPSRALE